MHKHSFKYIKALRRNACTTCGYSPHVVIVVRKVKPKLSYHELQAKLLELKNK